MLIRAKGDLLSMAAAGQFKVIAHGCNCHNNMGGGIAAQVAKLYPEAKQADDRAYSSAYFPVDLLGNMSSAWIGTLDGPNFVIVNAYTQLYGGAGTFSYPALELVLLKLANRYPDQNIGLPYIGCGIAGGDQNKIVDIIEQFAIKVAETGGTVTLVEFGA